MNLRFDIVSGANRPIVEQKGLTLLFDTGASTPVWCVGKKMFCKTFPDATKQEFKYILSGFGRTEQELQRFMKHPNKESVPNFLTDVYNIPSFCLSAGENIITWKNLKVAVAEKEGIGAELILSSTMFRGMELRWNQAEDGKYYIELESKSSVKYVFVQKYPDKLFSQELLHYIYSEDDLELRNLETKKERMKRLDAF